MLLGLHMDQLALREPDLSSSTSIPPGPKSFLFNPPSLEMHLETACVFTGGLFHLPPARTDFAHTSAPWLFSLCWGDLG